MKTKLKICLALCLNLVFIPSAMAEYTLNITITGFINNKGNVHVVVYDQPKGYPTNPKLARIYKISAIGSDKRVSLRIPTSIKGAIAVAAYHDENSNGKLDSNFIGIPREGTGASNNAKSAFGPPKFKDAKFDFPEKNNIYFSMEY